jgi:hypothetical protein
MLNKEGQEIQEIPKEMDEMVNDYALLQYDILFGNQYFKIIKK